MKKIVGIALKGVAAGMGIAVTVLSILGTLEVQGCITMLGIGLACVGIYLLQAESYDEK